MLRIYRLYNVYKTNRKCFCSFPKSLLWKRDKTYEEAMHLPDKSASNTARIFKKPQIILYHLFRILMNLIFVESVDDSNTAQCHE